MPMAVEDICKLYVRDPAKLANCNEFLQAVALKVGTENGLDLKGAFAGNANAIRGRFSTEKSTAPPFIYIGRFPDKATHYAAEGQLVVGGLTQTEMTYTGRDRKEHKATMGHMVVVVPGGPSKSGTVKLADGTLQPVRGGYPYCYQGAAHEIYRFRERTQVDAVFPTLLLDGVIYAYIDIKKKK
jgi:hypothetical protein